VRFVHDSPRLPISHSPPLVNAATFRPRKSANRLQAGKSYRISGNRPNISVAGSKSPIIMIGDRFVLTQHDLLEGKVDLSKFLAFEIGFARSSKGRRWSL